LATIRKAAVMEVLEHHIEQLACGTAWAERAKKCRDGTLEDIGSLQRDVGGSPGFALRMRSTEWNWRWNRRALRAEFLRLCKTYGISNDHDLCHLALRLAFRPATIRYDTAAHGAAEFEKLCRNGPLIRGAYFARLAWDLRLHRNRQYSEAAQ
jgi:hypothetical protein